MSRLVPDPWQPTTDKLDLAVLGKMGEELSECSTVTNRCIIQGIDEREPETGKLNREWLMEEIADVLATTGAAIAHFGLDDRKIAERVQKKLKHFSDWHTMLGSTAEDAA